MTRAEAYNIAKAYASNYGWTIQQIWSSLPVAFLDKTFTTSSTNEVTDQSSRTVFVGCFSVNTLTSLKVSHFLDDGENYLFDVWDTGDFFDNTKFVARNFEAVGNFCFTGYKFFVYPPPSEP